MDNNSPNTSLEALIKDIESIFEFVKSQGMTARDNLNRSESIADADDTERAVFSKVMKIGQRLMCLYLEEVTMGGDLGTRIVINEIEYVRRIKDRPVKYLTIFGEIDFWHSLYYAEDGSCLKPVEAMANLPERKASYFVQDLLARLAVDQTYEASKNFFEKFSAIKVSKRTVEEIVKETAAHHEEYKIQNNLSHKIEEGSIPVVSLDGKGVPVVPEDRVGDGTKKEALIGAVFTVNPAIRTAEQVANSLVCSELLSEQDKESIKQREHAKNIHYDASLEKDKADVFQSVSENAKRRFNTISAPVVCIMDGATILWKYAHDYFPDAIYILDIIHVLEYVWKAVNVLEPKKDKARILAATYLQLILEGKVKGIIGALRQRITKNGIAGSNLETLQTVITYFQNHVGYMHYDVYLAKGYPIGTGIIESACGHIVKDRMEKAGARWKIVGAEPVLKLRCAKANDDWDIYIANRKNHEHNRLYRNMLTAA
jgi:hypothetical protein